MRRAKKRKVTEQEGSGDERKDEGAGRKKQKRKVEAAKKRSVKN